MPTTLTMTIIGPDKPGLVEALAKRISKNGGNWLDSRLSRLGGQFAGILSVHINEKNKNTLIESLEAMKELSIHICEDELPQEQEAAKKIKIEIVGGDKPGIVHQIARTAAAHSTNIEILKSERENAPMYGGMLFRAELNLSIPESTSIDDLQNDIESLAHDIMVDIQFAQNG